MTKQQELEVRQRAARHLSGIPAIQNNSAIDHLMTEIAYEEFVARVGIDEIERCNRLSYGENQ